MLRAASILEQVEDWKVIEQDLDTEWTEPGTVTQPEPTQPGTGGWCGTPIRYPPTRQRVEDWRRVELESHRPRLNWGETTYERGVFSRAWRVGWMVIPIKDYARVGAGAWRFWSKEAEEARRRAGTRFPPIR